MDKVILWVSSGPLSGGSFGTVSSHLCKELAKEYKIFFLAYDYRGIPMKVDNYTVLPYGSKQQFEFYNNKIDYDLLFHFHSFICLDKIDIDSSKPNIMYLPVEGKKFPIHFKKYLSKYDQILTTSEWSKKTLTREGFKSKVIYHGVDSEYYSPLAKNESEWKVVYGYLGQNDIRKNVPKIMEAYSKVPGMKSLNLATKLQNHYNLQSVAEELNIQPEFLEAKARGLPVSPEKVREFYQALDIYLSPATEGFCLPALESASCGVPSVVLDTGAAPEVLGDSATTVKHKGWIRTNIGDMAYPDPEDLVDKMIMLHNDKQLRDELGNKARERAKEFTWNKSTDKVKEVVDEWL